MNTSLRFAVLTGFRLGKAPRIIYQELVQAHGEAICPAERTVERWVCEMKKGTFPLVKNKPPGRPRAVRTTDLVQDVSKMLQDNPRSSLREVALQLGTDHMTIFRIVTCDLDLKSVCSVWVPAVLSEANKKDRIKCAKTILKNVSLSVQHKYCVEDELWVNWGVIGTKMQNRAWLPKGARTFSGTSASYQKPTWFTNLESCANIASKLFWRRAIMLYLLWSDFKFVSNL